MRVIFNICFILYKERQLWTLSKTKHLGNDSIPIPPYRWLSVRLAFLMNVLIISLALAVMLLPLSVTAKDKAVAIKQPCLSIHLAELKYSETFFGLRHSPYRLLCQ